MAKNLSGSPGVRQVAHINFASGYGQAMVDVANKILDEGRDAGVRWVYDNCPDAELAKRLYDVMREAH